MFIDDRAVEEPYVRSPAELDLAPRNVGTNRVFLIGDNRGMSDYGEAAVERLAGKPLW